MNCYVIQDMLICGTVCFIVGTWFGVFLGALIWEEGNIEMTEQEAKKVIREDPGGNITNRIEAINVAVRILGQKATMREIYAWAGEENNDNPRSDKLA